MKELDREYLLSTQDIDFKFYQNEKDFVVDEIPLGEFLGKGNYLILHVQKKELTTWDMIAVFAEYLAIPAQKIGYAGLKDKHATTTQYISVESKYEKLFNNFQHKQIKILGKTRHSHSIRMGDLKGNRFSINLYDVDAIDAGRIEKVARKIAKSGLPNYFGYQRFGREAGSIEQAREMIKGELFIEDAKLKSFLISVYQSYYFNEWLRERVFLSKEKESSEFVLLNGDIYMSNDGKLSTPKLIPSKEFATKKVVPTGLLCGRDVFRAKDDAAEIESKYDDEFLQEKGQRREALVYPSDIDCRYVKKETMLNISFMLPKGSYATVFLESIAGKNYSAKDVKLNKNRKK
ncbi:MAG: pseudouridine synthase [Sulfurimonas sp. RIFOXYD12_FULL_33_39]|uniref:tRNA pseudouridine(13) synthase TruD n=1 Tax=Sulfurimonas sp. RIFOXYD2_FULL_34_21 TaxID=1802261 RepID=UPI0008CAE31D|nr:MULTISPECIES: tRNA pseudouridine(13) synthase TruD [unclassified Sulfurimonas]OHE03959.1 MAG: pseudouridine synthase [Sulfurimonas sp. RIFCSPLOWO2_12_FULL_34_6]OHE10060.1 MAG: pseudouridine synthase [Sulfurimonas sp. RIFOXYD12_FULL_33_39]OHE14719.1 MAG: pseudouridine synthase [Sulfurimonas sp. RIFOXYD2_FULL_34_21]DAB27974.1 MAG TPA: pseudouridine synthase [Sulfurimonas sp. UBA10385]